MLCSKFSFAAFWDFRLAELGVWKLLLAFEVNCKYLYISISEIGVLLFILFIW